MDANVLKQRLDAALRATDPISAFDELTDSLSSSGAGIDAVVEVLRCMEANPDFDFGTPGPLVHWVEEFFRRGYEAALLASIERAPTWHTVGMLNRLINGTKGGSERARYVGALKSVAANESASPAAKERADRYLRRLS